MENRSDEDNEEERLLSLPCRLLIIKFAHFMCVVQGNPTCMLLTISVYAHLHLEDGTEDEIMESVGSHFLTDYRAASSLLRRGVSEFPTNWSSSSLSCTILPLNDYASQRISMPTGMCTPITSPSVILPSYRCSVSLSPQFPPATTRSAPSFAPTCGIWIIRSLGETPRPSVDKHSSETPSIDVCTVQGHN